MKIICITNTTNGVGLQRDGEIVRSILTAAGHQVELCHFKAQPPHCERADIAIFFEVLAPQYFGCANQHYFFANPEWFNLGWRALLGHIDLVLCKTRQTYRIFESLGCECMFTGFASRDMYDPTVPRQRRFLHLAGKSQTKNTLSVLHAWTQVPSRAELTLVSRDFAEFGRTIPHVRVIERATDAELRELINSHVYHLCTSAAEGFGHYLHEGLSAGAVIVTTDGEPMNEIGTDTALYVQATTSKPMGLVPYWHVTPQEIAAAVCRCLRMSESEIRSYSMAARARYVEEVDSFHSAIISTLNSY